MATSTHPPLQEPLQASEALEAHVQRMLRSPHFARAETQRRLLEYLWQHRHETLSEYALATEALGRNSSFDSTSDASVRVHISRLRRKLKDYYQHEAAEPEMLVIPTGTHQLIVIDHFTPLPELEIEEKPKAPGHLYWLRTLAVLCVVLLVTVGFLGWKTLSLRQRVVDPPAPTGFWADFLQGNAPIKIILPTPVFFSFEKEKSFRLRSTMVNKFGDIQADAAFVELTAKLGKPSLEQPYTVTWDTLAAIDMARYLDSVGGKQRLSFEVMRDSNMMVLEQANVIAVGTHQTLQPLHEYLQAMNFSLAHDETRVTNAKPQAGEQASYEVVQESKERVVRPSIIAVLPGRGPGLKVLLLQSRDTAAIVTLLSSAAGSHSIEEMLKKSGNPRFYEMVVNTEIENNHPLRTWPVAVHVFSDKAPANAM